MSGETILIVEDEKIIGLDLQRRLEKFGYRVAELTDSGEAAVEAAQKCRPDIVLMDIMLGGGIDGIDAAKTIRSRFNIPVIFLTAYADETTLSRAKEAEPFGYVLKPYKERELFTTIDIALYKHSMDKKLLRQERWFSAILQSAGDGIIATDRSGVIRFMNTVAEILTGRKEEECRELTLSEVFNLHDDGTEMPLEIPARQKDTAEGPLFFEKVHILNRRGAKIHIEGSLSEILDNDKNNLGQVAAFRDVTDIRRMTETINYQARHDPLTGLMNREEFLQKMSGVLTDPLQRKHPHSLVYLDIDRFRMVNDLCGHQAGDELLRQIAEDIRVRFPSGSVLGRLGGDEFGILLYRTTTSDAANLALDLKDLIQRNFLWQKNSFRISASIGIVPVGGDVRELYNVLVTADNACCLAKEEGGNRVKVYETTDHRFVKLRGDMQWIYRLTRALEENRFRLYYQPIQALHPERGMPDQIEILLRLEEPDGSIISPATFIPAAERYNFMPAVDRWVLREAMDSCRRCMAGGRDPGHVFCINLSSSSLADESLSEYITGLFSEYDVPGGRICFEITETAAIVNLSRAAGFIRGLKKAGAAFALDDFGNGFSSFAHLKHLPVDFLKIDGSYVKGIAEDGIDAVLVEAVNSIGHAMGMKTIAEFVQSRAIIEKLKQMGVDYGQGYEIAEPAPLSVYLSGGGV